MGITAGLVFHIRSDEAARPGGCRRDGGLDRG
jgi:hypothetical protein